MTTTSNSGGRSFQDNPVVLVVDDEELIREVASMMIEEEGGTVLAASSGKQAIELLRSHQGKISCVLSDFSMPEMNGFEVYQEAIKIQPQLPFVMVSGLQIVPEVEQLRSAGRVQFISKPFQQTDLVSAINRARKR